MSEFDDELTADAYLMRRLALARRAADLPASIQFDLARSPIPDDQLEGVLGEFGVELGSGWGIADITHRLLSGSPDTKAVGDIKQLQTNLKLQGYLPPSYTPTGIWNDQDYIALRQADRDAMDAQRSGKSLLAAPVSAGMRLITDTLPSRVWQGVVGSAKGLIAQAAETAERVGALGGAAGGALIGTAIAPGVGTVVGSIAGAAIGFFGDLFGEEEDEADQAGFADLIDVLSPFEEYSGKDGIHQFFEDLSFVGTAASLAAGVGVAARGAAGAIGAARAGIAASETVANPGAMAALSKLPNVPGTIVRTPGTGMSLARAMVTPAAGSQAGGLIPLALRHPVAAGGVLGGFQAMADPEAGITDVLEGAAYGAAGGLILRAAGLGRQPVGANNWVTSLRGVMDAHNLIGRPIFQLANGLYTGAASASIGARLVSGELLDTEGPAPTEIAKQIRRTKPLSSGMEIPIAGDLIDVAAFILYPTQLLPAKAGDLAKSFDGLLGEAGLRSWIGLVQHNDATMTVGKARTALREFFETRKVRFAQLHMDGAADVEAARLLNERGIREADNAISFKRTVAEVKKQMKSDKEYRDRLITQFLSDSEMVQYWAIHRLGGDGPFLDRLKGFDEATTYLDEFQREGRRLGTIVDEQPNSLTAIMRQQPGGAIRPVQPTVVPSGMIQENSNRILLTQLTREKAARQKFLDASERALQKNLKGDARVKIHQTIADLRTDINALDSQINAIKAQTTRRKRLGTEVHVVPARLDTHTRNSIFQKKTEYLRARDEFVDARTRANQIDEDVDFIAQAQLEAELAVAQQQFETKVTELLDGGLITPKQAEDVLNRGGKGKATRTIENSLEAQAIVAARDIELPPEAMRYLSERGYKPVVTGDEVFVTADVEDYASLLQVGNYSRRRNFVESLGLGTRHVKEESLYKITHAQMVAEVDQVLAKAEVPLKGSAALKKLQTFLEARNSKAVVEFPVIGPLATALRFKADIRRLSPAEIEEALGGIRGFDSTMANEVYRALKRGAAFGRDFEFLPPHLAVRQIGQAMRTSGLPGFSQVIRSWHGKVDPFALKRRANVLQRDLEYNPSVELANSSQRTRVVTGARTASQLVGMSAREIREGERLLDVMAETATRLRPDLYPTVNDFFRGINVDYHPTATNLADDALRQFRADLAPKYPEAQALDDLALHYEDAAKWYHDSAIKLAEIFSEGSTVLRDGRLMNDYDLFKEILAATSPQTKVVENMADALQAFTEFKKTGKTIAKLPGPAGPNRVALLDDIFNGHTMDRWAPMDAAELASIDGRAVVPTKFLRTERNLSNEIGPSRRVRDASGNTTSATGDVVRTKAQLDALKEKMVREGWGDNYVTAEVVGSGRTAKIQVIDGTHRLMLAEELGLKKIPVKFRLKRGGQVSDELAAATQIYLGKKGWIGGRPKVRNFRNNLDLSEDHVTVDVWMARLFRGRDEIRAGEYEAISSEIREVANRIGYSPAQTQAMLWVGFKKEYIARLEEARAAALAAGDKATAKALLPDIRAAKNSASFGEAAQIPRIAKLIEEYQGTLGKSLLQKVENGVRGSITFGPEYQSAIRLYSTGGFDTLVHEGAHLMRRILPAEDLAKLEAAYGVRAGALDAPVVKAPLIDIEPHVAEIAARSRAGGATFNPHTGEFHEGTGFAVGMVNGTSKIVKSTDDVEKAIRQFRKANEDALANERAHVGTWESGGDIHLDPSEVVTSREEAIRLGVLREQEAVWDFAANGGKGAEITITPEMRREVLEARDWPVEAEERFAEDFTAFMMGKYKGTEEGLFGSVRAALATMWARNRDGFLDVGVVPFGMHRKMNELFRKDIEKLGLRRTSSAFRSKQVIVGTGLGAAEGALTGDQGFEDTLKGALFGAGVGLGARVAMQKSYGYLPDALSQLNMTLRYTLSFTFDLGRHMEQRSIAAMKYGLPSAYGSPNKYLSRESWKSPYRYGEVTGETAIADANRFYDEIHGTNYFAALQEFEQKNFQRGLLGFAPREYEVAQAFQMYQRGWSKELIKERVAELGRYGLSRTNFERSVNFVFFPFSFQKKLLGTVRDFIFQAPGRNLLIHEGLRRYHMSLVDDEFHSLIEDRLPLLEQLWLVNNLAFGASLGRFFMEGLDDRRTNVGRITQMLSSIFVPSGAATPLQQAFGAAGDLSVGAFVPVVITGESLSRVGGIDGLDDIVRRYVPFMREIEKWATTLNDQKVAALSPQHLTPYSQLQEYYEGKDAVEEQYSTLATAMGYSSVSGFLNSPMGILFKSDVDAQTEDLRRQYPDGFRLTTEFENQQALDAAALQDLAKKPDKTDGEEAFLELLSRQQSLQTMTQWLPEEQAAMMEASAIRAYSLRWVNDTRFAELYDRFMTRTYGPIRRVS